MTSPFLLVVMESRAKFGVMFVAESGLLKDNTHDRTIFHKLVSYKLSHLPPAILGLVQFPRLYLTLVG